MNQRLGIGQHIIDFDPKMDWCIDCNLCSDCNLYTTECTLTQHRGYRGRRLGFAYRHALLHHYFRFRFTARINWWLKYFAPWPGNFLCFYKDSGHSHPRLPQEPLTTIPNAAHGCHKLQIQTLWLTLLLGAQHPLSSRSEICHLHSHASLSQSHHTSL